MIINNKNIIADKYEVVDEEISTQHMTIVLTKLSLFVGL